MIAVNTQTIIFLQALLLGAALGVVYDLFRIFRIAIPLPASAVVAEDVIYFVFCGFVSFFFAMTVNFGQVRFFILLGETLGFLLYYLTVGALVMKCAKKIIAAIRWILLAVWKWLLRPVVQIFFWIGKKSGRIFGKIGKNMKKVVQKHRKHLQTNRILLYNYFKNRRSVSKNRREKIRREH
ncbi:MAG: spore cortex biosynthesis protein YabQ [Oscillospiraceae bacterium]|nr:spore cortex biosynthesis protein YabQ [Oscillospiraceae bacterium]